LPPRVVQGPSRLTGGPSIAFISSPRAHVVARETARDDEALVGAANIAAEDRAETIEYFKTLGTIGGGAFALFVTLTAAAGLDDVAAGNLVLVALCIYGAYLLFFDGGVTQAALENQAIAQLANEEADIMAGAPRYPVQAIDATAAAFDPAPAVSVLKDDGYAKLTGALSTSTAEQLLEFVNEELARKRADEKNRQESGELSATSSFGDVLMRDNRYDLYLDIDPPVRQALKEVLTPLKPVISDALGSDAELFELGALVSDPRAPRQPVHPDTPYRDGQGAAAITAFFALQDVEEDMGPTGIIPRTHTKEMHERFNSRDDGGRERIQILREKPNHLGVLNTGDANLIDSRLIHCGGGNDSAKRRVLFYLSFKAKEARVPSGSLFYHLRRAGYTIGDIDEWVENGQPLEFCR